jgi:nucleoside-diphosphate-sugar epimerase
LLDALRCASRPLHFINTGTVLDNTVNTYAWSKNLFSAWGSHCAKVDPHLQFTDVRLQHFYGPGDHSSKFTANVITSCLENMTELKLTSGEQRRDFVFIDDVIDAYKALVESRMRLGKIEAIEVGSGTAISVRTFVERVHAMTNSRTVLRFGALPQRTNEAGEYVANIGRMRSLGWAPRTCLNDGLLRTISSYVRMES